MNTDTEAKPETIQHCWIPLPSQFFADTDTATKEDWQTADKDGATKMYLADPKLNKRFIKLAKSLSGGRLSSLGDLRQRGAIRILEWLNDPEKIRQHSLYDGSIESVNEILFLQAGSAMRNHNKKAAMHSMADPEFEASQAIDAKTRKDAQEILKVAGLAETYQPESKVEQNHGEIGQDAIGVTSADQIPAGTNLWPHAQDYHRTKPTG